MSIKHSSQSLEYINLSPKFIAPLGGRGVRRFGVPQPAPNNKKCQTNELVHGRLIVKLQVRPLNKKRHCTVI